MRVIEKIVSLIVIVTSLVVLWGKTHDYSVMAIFGVIEILLFLMIWFSSILSEYMLPFMNIWAPLARDFGNYNRSAYSVAIKIIGWVLIMLVFLLTFCVKKQV